jgi:hypothetical protein
MVFNILLQKGVNLIQFQNSKFSCLFRRTIERWAEGAREIFWVVEFIFSFHGKMEKGNKKDACEDFENGSCSLFVRYESWMLK